MRSESLNNYEHDLELELDGAVEVRPGAMAAGGALLIIAVILTALNLRPAITSIGPVLGEMRESLGASAIWAGALTTLPGLCFAAAGLAAPWLARRIGLGRAIALALAVLSIGLVVRVLDGQYVVIGGTLVATAGIALVNVLIPVVIKGSFPAQIGLMTGIYTAALQGGGALGSAVTPPLEPLLGGWRGALGAWALVAVVALVFWAVGARGIGQARAEESSASGTAGRSLLRSPLAWTVTLFFGCQAFLAYVVMGWLPEVFIDSGVSKTNAGLLLGLVSILAVPISLFVAPMAARQTHQSGWIVALGLVGIVGMIGLLVDPGAAPLLWSVFVGLGMSVFSLALTVIALRARNAEDTARLSGMAQGFGYLLAGVGPFLFGLLHDVTGGWTAPWAMALVVYVVQMVAGAFAGRSRYV
ncbi:MAG: MFS transporter [Mycolicibacterium mageritense]|nr:MAG: MFS transporter [Mycolicibacterium mageritense]